MTSIYLNIKRSRERHLPVLFGLVSLAVSAVSGCSGSAPMQNLVSQVGQPCQDCSTCTDAFENCRCVTCAGNAYDPVKKELLGCVQGEWAAIRQCPGGVSAVCTDKGFDPKTQCLDANGTEIH